MVNKKKKAEARIMVVDDNDLFLKTTKTNLEWKGYEVKAFGSCEQAKKFLQNNQCDIALIDLDMENDDEIAGLTLSEELLKINKLLKIIMVTNYSLVPIAVSAMKIGAFSFVGKEPLRWDVLLTEIKQAMLKSDLEKQEADVLQDIAVLISDMEGNINRFRTLEKRWDAYRRLEIKFKQHYLSEEHKNNLRKMVASTKHLNHFSQQNRSSNADEKKITKNKNSCVRRS